jgi:hypothetical protein
MVSYGYEQAVEKLAPVGNPWAGIKARDGDDDE